MATSFGKDKEIASVHSRSFSSSNPDLTIHQLDVPVHEVSIDIVASRDVEAVAEKFSQFEPPSPHLVTWDGPDDPTNPRNWSTKRKWAAVLVVSSFTFISPVSSAMVAPALQKVGKDLGISGDFEKAMVLSIFVLAYAIGMPSIYVMRFY